MKSLTSRLKIGIDSFMMQLKLEHGKSLSKAEVLDEEKGGVSEALAAVNRRFIPGPTGASCSIGSAASVYLSGGTGGQQPASAYTAPPGTGKGPPPIVSTGKPMGPFRAANGQRIQASAAWKAMGDTSKLPADSLTNQYAKAADQAATDCRNNLPAGSECDNQWKKVQADFIDRQNYYGPDQKNGKFLNADIMASTLLGADTLATDDDNTAISAGKFLSSTTGQVQNSDSSYDTSYDTANNTINMIDAAKDFCKNLTDPTILAPNRGAAKASSTDRQAHAVVRAGWDARLSLASTICNEAVGRRLPKDYQANDTSGASKNGALLEQLMQEVRQKTCDLNGKAANLNCGNKTGETNILANVTQFSDYEGLKTLMTKLLAAELSAQQTAASDNTTALQRLLQADQLAVMMNYRIWELQERLNLVKAAQLAQQVENERTEPAATGPQ